MNMLRKFWWYLIAQLKGVPYQDYIDYRLEKCKKELHELEKWPDTNNFLSLFVEYYSFKSLERSLLILVSAVGLSLIVFIVSDKFGLDFVSLISAVWIVQALMFAGGFCLSQKYKNHH
jgi:hypothetical protein